MKKPDRYYWDDNYRAISATEYKAMIDALAGMYEMTKDVIGDEQVFTKEWNEKLIACKEALEIAGCEL